MDESTLINGIIAGDPTAFRLLVEQYREKVSAICYNFVLNREDARDLAQEVFIEVHASISGFRKEARLSTWIYRIAANKSINFLKKKKRSKFIVLLDDQISSATAPQFAASGSESDAGFDDKEMAAMLDKAISSLPDSQRVAFTLSKYDELPYKEIADIMELSVSSVESLIHRAKLRLQKQLSGYFQKK